MKDQLADFSLVKLIEPTSFIARYVNNNDSRVIAIFGPSGGGKTTLSHSLCKVLGDEQAVLISVDDYWRYTREEMKLKGLTGYDWSIRDKPRFLEDLAALLQGKTITKPVFDYVREVPTDKVQEVKSKNSRRYIEFYRYCRSNNFRLCAGRDYF